VAVQQTNLRGILILLMLACLGFAGWISFRPYAWNPDPAARCQVLGVEVKRDRSFCWLEAHLKVIPGQNHDMEKPVRLVVSGGRQIEPADTTMEGETGGPVDKLWFKFWLDAADMDGPLALRINDGSLSIKAGQGMPTLNDGETRLFTTHHW
jgi:hypothetical protein